MNIPIYSPHQLVRIELLRYENPEGLHCIEASYRNLCRDMLQHIEALQAALENSKTKHNQYNIPEELKEWTPMKFPQKFTGTPV